MDRLVISEQPFKLVVTEDNHQVVLTSQRVGLATVIATGPQGPQGAPGSGNSFVFSQSSPSSTWTINHNLGFKPSVELLNSGSQEIEGDVVHTSENQAVVTFTSAIAGFARLN